MSDGEKVWADAVLALTLFAVDPPGTGVFIRAPAGVVRDRWLARLATVLPAEGAMRKIPATVGAEALLGGLDFAASLHTGRKVAESGVLQRAAGGILVAAMAERLSAEAAGILAAALDDGGLRLGLVALDEGLDDEALSAGLADRLAFPLDLSALSHHDLLGSEGAGAAGLAEARRILPSVVLDDGVLEALCTTSAALGAGFARAPLMAIRAAQAAAALDGRTLATLEDAALAARLVLAPRATRLPSESEASREQPPPPEPSPEQEESHEQEVPPDDADIVLAAAKAAIPSGLLARLEGMDFSRAKRAGTGKAGARQKSSQRGRPIGVRAAPPAPGLRMNLIETLRAAAPWQRVRASNGAAKIKLRREDFRVTRTEQRARSTTIFLVDASGSAALNRLAEAKGAVELLLADCYQRRDEVAVLAFRGRDARLLLPPTRSLVRAKRSLAGLPGGGGTPLAAGIDAGFLLAELVRRAGDTPTLVLLTDGRANVSLSGAGGRAQAEQDALGASRRVRAAGHRALFLDISPRAGEAGRRIAQEMGALYLALPYADAKTVSGAVLAAAKKKDVLF